MTRLHESIGPQLTEIELRVSRWREVASLRSRLLPYRDCRRTANRSGREASQAAPLVASAKSAAMAVAETPGPPGLKAIARCAWVLGLDDDEVNADRASRASLTIFEDGERSADRRLAGLADPARRRLQRYGRRPRIEWKRPARGEWKPR